MEKAMTSPTIASSMEVPSISDPRFAKPRTVVNGILRRKESVFVLLLKDKKTRKKKGRAYIFA